MRALMIAAMACLAASSATATTIFYSLARLQGSPGGVGSVQLYAGGPVSPLRQDLELPPGARPLLPPGSFAVSGFSGPGVSRASLALDVSLPSQAGAPTPFVYMGQVSTANFDTFDFSASAPGILNILFGYSGSLTAEASPPFQSMPNAPHLGATATLAVTTWTQASFSGSIVGQPQNSALRNQRNDVATYFPPMGPPISSFSLAVPFDADPATTTLTKQIGITFDCFAIVTLTTSGSFTDSASRPLTYPGGTASATCDFSSTLSWGGILSVTEPDGVTPHRDFRYLGSPSGFDYRRPFRTPPGPTPVPLPSAAALLLLALGGLLAVRVRRG
jgi:hypothetical protein